MIKHIVMWRLGDSGAGPVTEEIARELKSRLEALEQKIPELRRLEVGLNLSSSEAASDVVFSANFETLEDLEIYRKHPDHLEVVAFLDSIKLETRVVDYRVPPD